MITILVLFLLVLLRSCACLVIVLSLSHSVIERLDFLHQPNFIEHTLLVKELTNTGIVLAHHASPYHGSSRSLPMAWSAISSPYQ
jgi:hypothetical protein